ncbi:ABC transporter permease subunit [Membranihabitans maritimus]|uniref:ABC transporter permease subunit n=1 Tax=Membranihabitans maritimus TaxID=2904244 RepID=UPI001F02D30F|nr:ABC transporter permease subunit [Membranihabitans maritimus]
MKISKHQLGIVFFILIGVVPFFGALLYAVLYSFGIVGILNEGFTFLFWKSVFHSGDFVKSLGYSMSIALVSVILSVGGALWLAINFTRNFQSRFFSFIIYLPLAIPGIVTAFFTFQLLSKGGLFSRIFHRLGWIESASGFPDLVNDTYAIGIVLAFITLVLPFFLLLFLSVYKNENIEQLSSLAKSLGANSTQVIRRIIVPILLKKTWIVIVLYFIFLLGSYEVPLILGQEHPQMLSVLIIREIKQYDLTKISEGYAIAVMYTIMVSLAALILFLPKKKISHET